MRIEEFAIMEYGPLPERSRIKLENFNLIYGCNESGKTLTIDALIKILLGKNIDFFNKLERVKEKPLGFIKITEYNGTEFTLKANKTIEDFINISRREFYNLFIIRDSYLSLYNENEIYSSITDRLLGLRLSDIEVIIKEAREIGKITRTGKFRDIGNEKLNSRVMQANDIIEEIRDLQEKIKIDNIEILEEQSHELEDQLRNIEKKINSLENARKREFYEKASKAITNYDEFNEQLKDYEKFDDESKRRWELIENEIKIYEEQSIEEETRLDQTKEELKKLESTLYEKTLNFQTSQKIKNFLNESIYPEKKEYDIKKGEIAGKLEKKKFYKLSFFTSCALLVVFLFFAFYSTAIYITFVSFLFAFIAVIFWLYIYQIYRENAWLIGYFERLKTSLSGFKLDGEIIEEINIKIENFEQQYLKDNTIIEDMKRIVDRSIFKANEILNEKIPSLRNLILQNKEKISTMKSYFQTESINKFSSKLTEKADITNNLNAQKTLLLNNFDFEEINDESLLVKSKEELRKYEKYKDMNVDLTFDENALTELKDSKEELSGNLREYSEKIVEISDLFKELERSSNSILKTEDNYLYCTTSEELDFIKNEIKKFIEFHKTLRENVMELIKILEEITIDEKEKISKLISEESSVSDYFRKITDGMYENVKFDMVSNKILVQRKDDLWLDIENLSGGSYDQLYFCIRLALGEKLLEEQPGFFILDDPFLKSDEIRLERQVKMLKDITDLGWQILYFTSKDEIKNVLRSDIEKGNINYIEFKPIIE